MVTPNPTLIKNMSDNKAEYPVTWIPDTWESKLLSCPDYLLFHLGQSEPNQWDSESSGVACSPDGGIVGNGRRIGSCQTNPSAQSSSQQPCPGVGTGTQLNHCWENQTHTHRRAGRDLHWWLSHSWLGLRRWPSLQLHRGTPALHTLRPHSKYLKWKCRTTDWGWHSLHLHTESSGACSNWHRYFSLTVGQWSFLSALVPCLTGKLFPHQLY